MTRLKLLLLAFVALTLTVGACELTFSPLSLTLGQGKTGKVVLTMSHEHRRCVLANEVMNYDAKGVTILAKGAWQEDEYGDLRQEISLRLDAKQGTLRVSRQCSRKGTSEGLLKIASK
ncbi:MAG TPA: hypothetical protein PKK12_08655 [Candidatus Aminicenantes bacterium]|nr:hypothetical protein [Candidatus Aminicenantes bacterium]